MKTPTLRVLLVSLAAMASLSAPASALAALIESPTPPPIQSVWTCDKAGHCTHT